MSSDNNLATAKKPVLKNYNKTTKMTNSAQSNPIHPDNPLYSPNPRLNLRALTATTWQIVCN